MIYSIKPPVNKINCAIDLTASKSISNRALIISAIGGFEAQIYNLSEADDTLHLKQLLYSNAVSLDAGDGGTTLRFLLAMLCLRGDERVVTASESLKARPVLPLLDALGQLGATFEFTEEADRLPIRIKPGKLTGSNVIIDGGISSQFISALMMIGPYLPGGLVIEITGEMLSRPYIEMTRMVMGHFGAEVLIGHNNITIPKGNYMNRPLTVEPDWSAASYWYEVVALSDDADVFLTGLSEKSWQGDSVISSLMEALDVVTTFEKGGCRLTKNSNYSLPEYYSEDFIGCPDLGPAVAATCAGLNITSDLTGLKNFRMKESDRASALQRELYNLNVNTDFCGGSKFKLFTGSGMRKWHKPLKTYNDHRIAMALAPLCLKSGSIQIENPGVVSKSYPAFWEDMKKCGFEITEV